MGVGEGRQQIVGNLVTEILVLVLVAVLEDERPTIRKCWLSRRNFLDENEVVTSISSSRTTTSARTKKESSLILQPASGSRAPPRHYIEVSQQVGRGVRSKASRTTRKINPKQNTDHNQRPERSLGVSPLGSQGNIFVV
jgi:hypothetical protein